MSKNCPIMQRMKDNYENRSKTYLTRKVPVIMRLDGKAFHTYTKGLTKPFDEGLIEDMQKTTIFLCENIQGVKCAYTQSDEISILITDYDKLTTESWFNYNVQKMTSVGASLATSKFNQVRWLRYTNNFSSQQILNETISMTLANFDSRVFSIPKDDVNNYFLARQRDAEKNSVAMLAQSLYSHKELHGKNGSDMQEMSWQKGYNWNDLHFSKKRGSLIVKNTYINGKLEYEDKNGDPEIGDLWYQPNSQSHFYPDPKGRLLEWNESHQDDYFDWMDIQIESVRTKWEVVETPIFSKSTIIKELI